MMTGAADEPTPSGGAGEPTPAGAADESTPACATCGAVPFDPEATALARLTWTRGVERGRPVWTCPDCTRRHARSIEGKLDSEWW